MKTVYWEAEREGWLPLTIVAQHLQEESTVLGSKHKNRPTVSVDYDYLRQTDLRGILKIKKIPQYGKLIFTLEFLPQIYLDVVFRVESIGRVNFVPRFEYHKKPRESVLNTG